MITSLGRHTATGAARTIARIASITAGTMGVTAGCLAAVGAPAPAWAGGFSATYTCDIPMLGSPVLALNGWLAPQGPVAAGRPAGFRLHVADLGLRAPVAVDSWSASARVDVGGTETTFFRVAGGGAYVPAGQPIAGDLTGGWTPAVGGSHVLSVGRVTLSLRTPATGEITARCVANEPRPAVETLMIPAYDPGWTEPVAPPPYEVVVPPYGPGPYPGHWHHGGWGHGGWHGGWGHGHPGHGHH